VSALTRSLLSASASGVLLKLAGVAFNVAAIPLILRSLGPDRYAAVALVLGYATWFSMGNMGTGTIIALEITRHDAKDSNDFFWQVAVTGTIGACLVSLALTLSFLWLSHSLTNAFDPAIQAELRTTSLYCFFAFTLMSVGSLFEGRFAGLMRLHYCNYVRLAGQVLALIALLIATLNSAGMLGFAIALTLGPLASAIWFIFQGFREGPPPPRFVYRPRTSFPIVKQGLGFLTSSLAIMFYSGGSLPLFTLVFGTDELATAGVMSRVVQLFFSLTAAFVHPLSFAVSRALASQATDWARQTVFRALIFILSGALAAAGVLEFYGPQLFTLWTGSSLPNLQMWCRYLEVLLIIVAWYHFWIYVGLAVIGSSFIAFLAAAELVTVAILYWALSGLIQPAASLLMTSAAMMALSGIFIPARVFALTGFRLKENK
jgi:O-antigen/teichoic acid export membrane protein